MYETSHNHRYGLGISDSETMSKLSEFAPSIEGWCRRFLHGSPQPGLGTVEFSRPGSHGASCVAVTEVLDIEENIWSPRYVREPASLQVLFSPR